MQIEAFKPTGCKLQHVSLKPQGGKWNVILKLSGDEISITAAEGILKLQKQDKDLGYFLVERIRDGKALKVTAAANAPHEEGRKVIAATVAQAVHNITGCRPGRLHMAPDIAEIPSRGGHTKHSMGVVIEPIPDLHDSANLAGYCAMEILRHTYENEMAAGCIPDPTYMKPGALRLFKVDKEYDISKEARHHAQQLIDTIEKRFGLYHPKPPGLRLTGLMVESHGPTSLTPPMNDKTPPQLDWHAITDAEKRPIEYFSKATLKGSPQALDDAERALKHAFPNKIIRVTGHRSHAVRIYEQKRKDDTLELTLQGDGNVDSALLIKKIRDITRCSLPLNIVARATPDQHQANYFNPALDADVASDVPVKARASTASALAGFIGLQIPAGNVIIPEHPEYGDPPRVVIHQTCNTEGEAHEVAGDLRELLLDRLKDISPGRPR